MSLPSFFQEVPIETAELYEIGGCHPINIGDTFNKGRYRVLNKLGRGANSTIWLIEDIVMKRLSSLKVLSADASVESSELKISQYLQKQQKQYDTHPGKAHVVTIIDTFRHEGPNGVHDCVVTELLGISLDAELPWNYYGPGLEYHPSQITTKVATQVALGLAYLHKCGIVHGNLKLGHVLFHSRELENASTDRGKRTYGEAKEVPIKRWCSGPQQAPMNTPNSVVLVPRSRAVLDAWLTPRHAVHVKICDFGRSSLCSSQPPDKPVIFDMPLVYRAPEIFFRDIEAPTRSTDMWAYGVLYMIMNGKKSPFSDRELSDGDAMLSYMIMTLGRLPEKWSSRWISFAKHFDEERLKSMPSLRMWISSKEMDIADEKCFVFEDILLDIFRYQPGERISAKELLQLLPPGWKHGIYKKKVKLLNI